MTPNSPQAALTMNVCPYCTAVLSHTPKRRTACPACGKPILVRKGRLRTDEEGRAIDWCSRLQIDEAEFQGGVPLDVENVGSAFRFLWTMET